MYLNLVFLLYCFTSVTVNTGRRNQKQEHEQIIDGAEFMKRIIGGSKINSRPNFLMFTAPYKLCEGECSNEKSVIGFPVYVGEYAKKAYKDIYIKNLNKNEPRKSSNEITKYPTSKKSTKTKKKKVKITKKTPPSRGSTTSTEPPTFDDKEKFRLNEIINCRCPHLDPNICYKKRVPSLREKHREINVDDDDINKLFTSYRKTKDIT